MKKISIWVFLLFVVVKGYAQQEAQYTQFMYNKLALNPAYAGSAEMPCISCIHRSQWLGFEGAPTSQVLNFQMPAFRKKVGLGASIAHDKIGPTNSYTASLMYAYRLKMEMGTLSIGMRGTLRSYQVKWSELDATHSGDTDIPIGTTSRIFPNFGAGVYFDAERFYVGLSMPNMLNNDLSYSTSISSNTDFGVARQHIYLMAGYLFDVGDNVKFKPAALLKYVSNAPLDLDLNATFIFMEKIWGGLSYRLGGDSVRGIGESIDLLLQYQINNEIRAGIAYDFTLSKIREASSGTVELQLHYCINKRQKENQRLTNPRFF